MCGGLRFAGLSSHSSKIGVAPVQATWQLGGPARASAECQAGRAAASCHLRLLAGSGLARRCPARWRQGLGGARRSRRAAPRVAVQLPLAGHFGSELRLVRGGVRPQSASRLRRTRTQRPASSPGSNQRWLRPLVLRAHMELAKTNRDFSRFAGQSGIRFPFPGGRFGGKRDSLPVTLVAPSPLLPAASGNGERRIGDLGVCR